MARSSGVLNLATPSTLAVLSTSCSVLPSVSNRAMIRSLNTPEGISSSRLCLPAMNASLKARTRFFTNSGFPAVFSASRSALLGGSISGWSRSVSVPTVTSASSMQSAALSGPSSSTCARRSSATNSGGTSSKYSSSGRRATITRKRRYSGAPTPAAPASAPPPRPAPSTAWHSCQEAGSIHCAFSSTKTSGFRPAFTFSSSTISRTRFSARSCRSMARVTSFSSRPRGATSFSRGASSCTVRFVFDRIQRSTFCPRAASASGWWSALSVCPSSSSSSRPKNWKSTRRHT
mmetsp:Transcript_49744/g.85525  ORF Transcript_49744/g.85525 Transcript_49744/m.85525 type:complete len:290 (-) Transcript_49744:1045-1914(-)